MLYLLYKIGIFLARTLPLRTGYLIADFAGNLYYLFARRDRKIVSQNIRVVLNHCASQSKIHRVSRKVFISFARYLVEFFRTPEVSLEYIREKVTIEGQEN